jgi:hypothetical protein
MTTPDDPTATGAPDTNGARIKRTLPPRSAANRMGSVTAGDDSNGPGNGKAAAAADPDPDQRLGEAAARSVRVGYEAIAANIRQGREAAAKFRQGQYNMRSVPEDLVQISERMQKLTSEFSKTGLEFVSWLANSAGPLATAAGGPPGGQLTFKVRQAQPESKMRTLKALTQSLVRPTGSVDLDGVSAEPLRPQTGKGLPIAVNFTTDWSEQAPLVAEVTIPDDQVVGVYSVPIYAKSVPAPIGVLSIEVLKA